MDTLINMFAFDRYGFAFVLATIVFLAGIVINWKDISEWIGNIASPEWLNTLAMVIACGLIPICIYYGRWIMGGFFIVAILYGFVK